MQTFPRRKGVRLDPTGKQWVAIHDHWWAGTVSVEASATQKPFNANWRNRYQSSGSMTRGVGNSLLH
jgi:hypothetical protein